MSTLYLYLCKHDYTYLYICVGILNYILIWDSTPVEKVVLIQKEDM